MSSKKNIVWFGMKLTPEEKKRIKLLSKLEGRTQKEAVMSAVNEKITEYEVPAETGSILDQIREHSGVVTDKTSDLSTNKKHLEGYGSKDHH
jgi:predicted DNA-binding protein